MSRVRLAHLRLFLIGGYFVLLLAYAAAFYWVAFAKWFGPARLEGGWFDVVMGGLVIIPGFLLAGFLLFVIRPYDKQAVLLALMFGSLALVFLPESILSYPFPGWIVMVLILAEVGAVALAQPVFLHFFLVFPAAEPPISPLLRRFPRLELYLYPPALLFAFPVLLLSKLPANLHPEVLVNFFKNYPVFHRIGNVVLILYMVGGLFSLLLNYLKAPQLLQRKIRVVLAGALAGILPLILVGSVSLLFGLGQLGWIWALTVLALVIVPPSFAYAIVRHQVIPVSLIIRRGIRYLLVSRGFLMAQILLAFVLLHLILTDRRLAAIDRLGSRADVIVAMTATVLAVGLLRMANRRVMTAIDRRFFRQAYNAQQVLNELAQAVRSIPTRQQLLEVVAEKIQQALHTETVTIFLRQPGAMGYMATISRAHPKAQAQRALTPTLLPENSSTVARLRKFPRPLAAPIARGRTDSGVSDSELPHSFQSALLVPLATKEQLLGFISLGPRLGDLPFSREDEGMLMNLAAQTAYALENAELLERKIEEEGLRRELDMAAAVQRRLFPEQPPQLTGLDLAALCVPARGVGGDYYDFLKFSDDQLAIAIADVSGKGMAAALLTSTVHASFRGQVLPDGAALTELISKLNKLLFESTDSNRYATLFYGHFDMKRKVLTSVNAGHNPPFLIRANPGPGSPEDAQIELLETGGPVIGLFERCCYEQDTLRLQPGDLLVAYTDGVVEAHNKAGEEFGQIRLQQIAVRKRHCAPNDLAEQILSAVHEWCGNTPQEDDITLLLVKVR